MTRLISLEEYQPSHGHELTPDERDAVTKPLEIEVAPSPGESGKYDLTPTSYVGVVVHGDLKVVVRPRFGIRRAMFLISYALDPVRWYEFPAPLDDEDDLLEAVVRIFCTATGAALRRGLLQGYHEGQELSTTIRGRIDVTEMVHRRYGQEVPVPVTFDEFDEDILENRLLKAAVKVLSRLPVQRDESRTALRQIETVLEPVSLTWVDPRNVPAVVWTRRNQHYRLAVELARVVLAWRSPELAEGGLGALAFSVDMSEVFERFVRRALRQALDLDETQFPGGNACPPLFLDSDNRVRLRPDLSWWRQEECRFVGDVKYKRIKRGRRDRDRVPEADLYQLLAYTVATGLPKATLVYAAGEVRDGPYFVPHVGKAGKVIEVRSLDVSRDPDSILSEIAALGRDIASGIGLRGGTDPSIPFVSSVPVHGA
jgi:5-methylcytosine-specific restriction enzyme subunit McrC